MDLLAGWNGWVLGAIERVDRAVVSNTVFSSLCNYRTSKDRPTGGFTRGMERVGVGSDLVVPTFEKLGTKVGTRHFGRETAGQEPFLYSSVLFLS